MKDTEYTQIEDTEMGTDEDYGGGDHMYPDDGDYDSSSDF
jgi:hypothetical protein